MAPNEVYLPAAAVAKRRFRALDCAKEKPDSER